MGKINLLRNFWIVLGLVLCAFGAVLTMGPLSAAHSTDLHVPGDHATIQAGIDAATGGDTVLVADGTYTGSGNRDIDFKGKAITVRSENGPELTIIDCEGTVSNPHRGFYFHNGETTTSVLDGFTIRNGYGLPEDLTDPSIPTYWSSGGGIFITNASPLIKNNIITGNTALYGAGIQCWQYASPVIEKNIISYNNNIGGSGGGVYFYNNCASILKDNIILYNTAHSGGGVAIDMFSSVVMVNNVIAKNSVTLSGGGLDCGNSDPFITNNTISENTNSTPGQGGGAYFWYASPTITNSIFWGNGGGEISEQGSTITINYSDVQGGFSGTGNIDSDPLFAYPDDDYHLQEGSPCINVGDNSAPQIPSLDFEGDSRIIYGTADMGADEYRGPIAYYLFNGNANDASGNGIHGDPQGTLSYAPGLCYGDQAANFDGSVWVELPSESSFDLTAFTIVALLKVQNYDQRNYMVSKGDGWGNYTLYISSSLDGNPGEAAYAHDIISGNWSHRVSRAPVPINEFFHVAVTLDSSSGSWRAYINGEEKWDLSWGTPLPLLNDIQVSIGKGFPSPEPLFVGVIDDIRIYDRALTEIEIKELVDMNCNGIPDYRDTDPCEGLGGDTDEDGICDDGDGSGTVGDGPCTGGNTAVCDDNCVNTSNADQADNDWDAVGDLCDVDNDNDGVCDGEDPSPAGTPGAVNGCLGGPDSDPLDPDVCGDRDGDGCEDCSIGTDDLDPMWDVDISNDGVDVDGDGLCDTGDACPSDPTNDADNDGICAGEGFAAPKTADWDNCPDDFNNDQSDQDEDGVGDACDNCIEVPNGPDLGTCVKYETTPSGIVFTAGATCSGDGDCPDDGDWRCNTNQENIDDQGSGDACDVADMEAEQGVGEDLIVKCHLSFPGTGDPFFIIDPKIDAFATAFDKDGNRIPVAKKVGPHRWVIKQELIGNQLKYTGDVIEVQPPWDTWIDVRLAPDYDPNDLIMKKPITVTCTAFSIAQDPACLGLGDPNDPDDICIGEGVRKYTETSAPSPFTVDDRWEDALEVQIDVKPNSFPNAINLSPPTGVIAVAVLTTPEFDATQVDYKTLKFAGASVARKRGKPWVKETDIDGDGDIDIISQYKIGDITAEGILNSNSTLAQLDGKTKSGTDFFGFDSVRVLD